MNNQDSRTTRMLAVMALVFVAGATIAHANLTDKELRATFSEKIKEVKTFGNVEVAEVKTEAASELKAISEEVKGIKKQQVLLHHTSTKYSLVEKHRKLTKLALRKKLLYRKAAYLKKYTPKKCAGLKHRASVICSRLIARGNKLSKKLRRGEMVTDAEVQDAIQACLVEKTCFKCDGAGSIECPKCEGAGSITSKGLCPDCHGKGRVSSKRGHRAGQCARCKGEGECIVTRSCLNCFGMGSVECTRCYGKGTIVEKIK